MCFFFQAEDGIRDVAVTGVQTCALPISQVEMKNFSNPQWSFRYRGWVDLLDFRETLHEPTVPTGRVDVRGEGQFASGQYKGSGSYSGQNIALPYLIFHATGLTSRGSYRIDNRGLDVPDFFAGAFGGGGNGRGA